MCRGIYQQSDAASELASLLSRAFGNGVGEDAVRRLLRNKWDTVCKLAHAVHDDEMSEDKTLKRAIKQVASLSEEGVENVLAGTANPDVIACFKVVAAKLINPR